MRMILASTNRGKFQEMKEQLLPYGIDLIFGGDLPSPPYVEETGATYEENAFLKARAWASSAKVPALADDSGLEVDALGGAPGVHSARVVPGKDSARTEWLLEAIKDADDRSARFVCSIAVVFPDGRSPLAVTEYCAGRIAASPAGESGFGYDPVFIPDGYEKTFSELGVDIKNTISHRAKAVKSIAEMLRPVIE
ncbi:MAG: RdgB/HAM1 family non-canonical purine NTP pyrophosphatase [Synergistes sp.]|nr:RdgB/HAM1 family non-canonical purine NTP pyrophosphatase [Synergistes sp.]